MTKVYSDSLFGDDVAGEPEKGAIIRVAFDSGVDSVFDYLLPAPLGPIEPGRRVQVPLGRKNALKEGFCAEVLKDAEQIKKSRAFKLKSVKKILDDEPLLDEHLMTLARWISDYYVCPLGQVLAAMVPGAVKKDAGVKKEFLIYLAGPQEEISEKIKSKKQRALLDVLADAHAYKPDSAVEKKLLLQQAGCTEGPLKNLHRKAIVKITERAAVKSIPVLPEGFALKYEKVVLNDDQCSALQKIESAMQPGRFGVTLLHGVTDSGKTELYVRAIETSLKMGKSSIVLLPEIALTAQTVQRFSSRVENIALMHSGLSAAQRNQQWRSIRAGRACVVIGARSAVFAPVSNLGLIVVDEEHEAGYKQDTVPRYHARDVAIKRAQLAGAHCLLGSATPSLETYYNSRTKGYYQLVKLTRRVKDYPMPRMQMVDMSAVSHGTTGSAPVLISPLLHEQILQTLERKEQVILLLNRRGYSNFVFCPSCRHSLHCQNCDVTLTFHKKGHDFDRKETIFGSHIIGGYALCHYCLSKTLVPQNCPLCGRRMTMLGLGSQRLVEELMQKIPLANVQRVDSDSMAANPENYYRVLRDFSEGRLDILAGTQILAKGLHFPNVTLVGIVSADTALALPDFRANERTFGLICQVAGRSGRSEKKGTVIVQTFLPNQPAIKYALNHDYEAFVKEELEHRQKCNLPPYWRMAIVHLRHGKFDRLAEAAEKTKQQLETLAGRLKLDVKIRGPMPAVISRIQRLHRLQLILQAPEAGILSRLLGQLRLSGPIKPAVTTMVDMDPVNLL